MEEQTKELKVGDRVVTSNVDEALGFIANRLVEKGCPLNYEGIKAILNVGSYFGYLMRHEAHETKEVQNGLAEDARRGLKGFGFGMVIGKSE